MQFLKNLYGYFLYTIIGLLFFVFMPPIWLFCSWPKTYPLVHHLRVWWGKTSFALTGYRIQVEKNFTLDVSRNYVVVFNHTSHLDIPLLFIVLHPIVLRFMAKAELGKLPVFGKFFRTIDFSVDRNDADDARKAFQRANDAVANGASVAIAPEGGTSKNPPELRKFKSGAFRLAIEHQVPILVVTMFDNWRILPSNGIKQGWHISRVKIHPPIETKNMKAEDYQQLSDQVQQLFVADLKYMFK
jgi:1-acyl-sn-glycerol-3-phosphate acyltransferase